MKQALIFVFTLIILTGVAQDYPTNSRTLPNGMKIIVCEKPGNDFVEVQVWYRTGSKDEVPGIRGMAHMFEHMMFRGTEKYPGNSVFKLFDKVGAQSNAYTTFDRTVYHEYVPVSALRLAFDLESDRMQNLRVTQEILNSEREVVGEELRNHLNNWYGKMDADRYPLLYPTGHPYEVNVIGHLDEILSFTTEQCMNFYNNYYSPNNAFLVVVGNVQTDSIFTLAEKYFGQVSKQLNLKKRENVPDVASHKLLQQELPLDFPVQIYSYVYPRPAAGEKDYYALNMLSDLLFTDPNSILNNRLVKKDYLAYSINSNPDESSLYPDVGVIDVIMGAQPGNVKVKRAIREEINKIAADGLPQSKIDKYIKAKEATHVMSNYSAEDIAYYFGLAEYYFNDYKIASKEIDEYRKVTNDDLKRVAADYFSEEKLQVINIKPD